MPKDNEDISLFSDLPLQPSEPQGFSPDQMVRCEECLRANPPTRPQCLYCGHPLPVSEATITLPRSSLRPPEKWEAGYSSILLKAPADGLSNKSMAQAASLLGLEVDDLKQIFLAQKPLPLARKATQEEAMMIERGLSGLGLDTMIVSDQALGLEASPPRRLRTLELRDNDLVAYQPSGSEGTVVAWNTITLVITARLFAKQVAFKERKRGKEIIDASETSSDEAVLDIYTNTEDGGWRIMGNSFDFSCLGDRKTLLAGENFLTVTKIVRDHAPHAEHDNSYNSLRRVLELVWPSEQQTASLGWHRDHSGKYSTNEIAMTSNEPQFTRYSRLCHFLKVTSLDQCR